MKKSYWKVLSFEVLAGLSIVLVANLCGMVFDKLSLFHRNHLSEVLSPEKLAAVVTLLLLANLIYSFTAAASHGVSLNYSEFIKISLRDLALAPWIRVTLLVLVYLGIGIVMTVAVYGVARFIWWLVSWLSRVPVLDLLVRFNFTISLAFVLISMLCLWIPSVFRRQSWKKLGDPILKWTGVSAVSVGGFGVIGLSDSEKSKLLMLAVSQSQVPVSTLQGLYAATVLSAVVSSLAWMVGSAAALDDNSRVPTVGFSIAFSLGWLSAVGMFTLCLDGSLLTLVGHLVQ